MCRKERAHSVTCRMRHAGIPGVNLNPTQLFSPMIIHYATFLVLGCSDVKRGQNLEAEARATTPRPRPRPKLRGRSRGRGQDYEVEAKAEAKNNWATLCNKEVT